MDEVRSREREYEGATETIRVNESDFGNIGNIKTIEEGELNDFLMGNIPDDEPVKPEPIKEKQPQTPEAQEEPRKKRQKEEEEDDFTSEQFSDYMNKRVNNKEDDEEDDEDYEPPKKQPKKAEKQAAQPTQSNDSDEESIYTTLARDLVKANIFSEDEDEEGEIADAATFKDKFIKEMNKGANSILEQFLGQHGQEYREAFDSIFVKGVDPRTYFAQYERIKDVEGLDIKDTEVQEQIMRQYFKSQGLDNDKINNKIQKLKDYGDLEEDSERIHSLMVKEEKRRLAEEEQAAEEEHIRVAHLKRDYQLSLQKILTEKVKAKSFNGMAVNHDVANRIFQQLTVDAYRLPNGQTITEFENKIMNLNRPENFEKKVLLAMLLDNDFDMSSIKQEAIKQRDNDIFGGLEKKARKREIPVKDNNRKSFFS